jgi:hypothetical protein
MAKFQHLFYIKNRFCYFAGSLGTLKENSSLSLEAIS